MNQIKYFIQFLFIYTLLILFKLIGFKMASNLSSKIFQLIGPYFRSKKIINTNILKALPNLDNKKIQKITNSMWSNYGRILSEYVFIKEFRNSKLSNNIEIVGQDILYICLSTLDSDWTPALKTSSVCMSIISMLSSATEK